MLKGSSATFVTPSMNHRRTVTVFLKAVPNTCRTVQEIWRVLAEFSYSGLNTAFSIKPMGSEQFVNVHLLNMIPQGHVITKQDMEEKSVSVTVALMRAMKPGFL